MNLWPYQIQAGEFVESVKRAYFAMGLGTGKTLTSVAAGVRLGKRHILVIAEKNEVVNSRNFEKEAGIVGLSYYSLRETPLKDMQGMERAVCGINPDALTKLDTKLLKALFDVVIIDEATMAKTTTTARFKVVRKVCKEADYLILLSGTPMMNGAAELYAPLLLMNHKLVGGGSATERKAFERIFAGGFDKQIKKLPDGYTYKDLFGKLRNERWKYVSWWAKGANNVRELRYLLRDQFFFMRKEDTGVFKSRPDRGVIYVPMTIPWLLEYNAAWETYQASLEGKHGHLAPSEYLERLENISELQRLIENGKMYQVNSKWKAERVVEDIASGMYEDRRIIVWCMFLETEQVVKDHLAAAGIPFRTFEEGQEWKDGDEPVLVGRIKAHGKGGNFAQASASLFVDMDYVPANNIQAENRPDRPEQTRDMIVRYYLTEGSDVVDAHIRRINQEKTRKIEEFMRPLTEEEITSMPERLRALRAKFPKETKLLGI